MRLTVFLLAFTLVSCNETDHIEYKGASKFLIKDKLNEIGESLNPVNWMKDWKDKFSQLVALTSHPNFGGVQLFSPQYLWEKWHEKTHDKPQLTGTHGSIYGLSHGHKQPVDYPFAYRKA